MTLTRRRVSSDRKRIRESMENDIYIAIQTGSKEATMRTRTSIGLLAVTAILLAASLSFAQPGMGWKGWRGSGGWGMGSQYNRMYNSATV